MVLEIRNETDGPPALNIFCLGLRISKSLVGIKNANGYGVSFWSDENFLKLIVVIVSQFYQYTKNDWIVHFK